MKASETAIILIEFQNDFCNPEGKLFSLVQNELTRNQTIIHAKKLLDEARQKGCQIIHCPFSLDKKWIDANHSVGILEGLYDNDIFSPGDWGHQIIDELAPRENEIVLEGKRGLSAFSHTNLAQILHFSKIKNVIIAGFLTNICAQATAWSAYDLGYNVRLIPQACCAASQEIQDYVETQICPTLGGALTVEELISVLD